MIRSYAQNFSNMLYNVITAASVETIHSKITSLTILIFGRHGFVGGVMKFASINSYSLYKTAAW